MSEFTVKSTVGEAVKILRLNAGLTQAQVAEVAGFGVAHVSRIERGASIPTEACLASIVQAIGVLHERFLLERDCVT